MDGHGSHETPGLQRVVYKCLDEEELEIVIDDHFIVGRLEISREWWPPVGVENVIEIWCYIDVTGRKGGPDHVWGHVSIEHWLGWCGPVLRMAWTSPFLYYLLYYYDQCSQICILFLAVKYQIKYAWGGKKPGNSRLQEATVWLRSLGGRDTKPTSDHVPSREMPETLALHWALV